VYDLDLFNTPQRVIGQLHALRRKVICYFNAGSWEDWRPDADQYPDSVLGRSLDQVAELLPVYDWALNEQCFQYNECQLLLPFVQSGKPVFGIEYYGDPENFCPQANSMDFDVLKKRLGLDAWKDACR
jgi:endo-alpha-1,4-polygalactosaminidase (GH114 family)